MTKHTPTPWRTERPNGQIYGHNGEIVIGASYGDNREEDNAFIVKAVNCHDELVAALEALECSLSLDEGHFPAELNMLRETIAKAKGEK